MSRDSDRPFLSSFSTSTRRPSSPPSRPTSNPEEDERLAMAACIHVCSALIGRLSVAERWNFCKTVAGMLAGRVTAGSRIQRSERDAIGVVPWLHFLDTLRSRKLSVEDSNGRTYLLVVQVSGSMPPPGGP